VLTPNASTLKYTSLKNLMGKEALKTQGEKSVIQVNNQIYFTAGNYVMKVNMSGDTYQLKMIPSGDISGTFSESGNLYINTLQQGLMKLEGSVFVNCAGGELLKNKIITGTAKQGDRVLIATNYDGLYSLNSKGLTRDITTVSTNGIAGICNAGNWLVVGYFSGGVTIINSKTREQKNIELPSNEIYSLASDIEGNIWIGHRKGLSIVYAGISTHYYPQCNTGGNITDLVDLGNVLLVSSYSGLDVIDKSTMQMKSVSGFSGEGLQLLHSDNDVLVASTSGLFLYAYGNAKLLIGGEPFVHLQFGNISGDIYAFAREGCYVIKKIGTAYQTRKLEGFNEMACSVFEEKEGYFWVGTYYNGIKKYQGRLKAASGIPEALYAGKVQLHQLNKELLIRAGDKVYTLSNGSFEINNALSELFVGCQKVPFHIEDNCWIIHSKGVAKYTNNSLQMQSAVNEIPGLISNVILSGKTIYAVSENKIYSCHDDENTKNKLVCRLNRLKTKHGIVVGDLLTDASIQDVEITYEENPVVMEIGMNAFVTSEKNVFRFQIVGTNEWSEWQEGGEINLSGLDAGNYDITIQGKNARGEEAEEAKLKVHIHPPWYLTVYAYLMYISALLLLIYLVVYLNNRRLILRNNILEAEVSARTSELKNSNAELMQEKKKSDDLLLNILPLEVANELKQNGFAKAKKYDQVTVLFTDFVNFTGISEKLSPEELVQEINKNFTAYDAIIEKYGLEKIKTIGDAYLAVGGMPIESKDHAVRVIKAAMEIQQLMEKSSSRFQVRIGINSGPVIAGIVGVKKYAYDIWGDTVNMAARMEQHSEAGKINISGVTYQLVKDKFQCEYRGKINAKNKGEVDMYFVKS